MVNVWLSLQLCLKNLDTKLLFTDTYSLPYEIKSEDTYEEFFKHKHLLEFGNYPKDSKFFDKTNKKVISKLARRKTSSKEM